MFFVFIGICLFCKFVSVSARKSVAVSGSMLFFMEEGAESIFSFSSLQKIDGS